MSPNQIIDDTKTKLGAAVSRFLNDLKSLRTGRANAAMLDGIMVEAYGTPMPLNQVSTVTAPESQMIQITPFDPSNIQAIATAIRNNPSLGLNPSDDGRVVRVPVPPLTEQRRRDIAKQIGDKVEDCMVRLRSVRHESLDALAQAKKDKLFGEDEAKRLEKQIDELMSSERASVDAAAKTKEHEIMSL
jgi:ribosome recycling factor